MAETPITGLPLLEEAQAGQATAANEILRVLDAVGQLPLRSVTTTAEPGAPVEGEAYFLPAGASGPHWTGNAGAIAVRLAGGWVLLDPVDGMRAVVLDEGHRPAVWQATAGRWVSAGLATLVETVALSGASASTAAGFLPDGATVFALGSEVVTEITGAASYSVGRAATTTEAGTGLGLGLAAGSAYHGKIQPVAIYAAEPVVVTAAGGDFTGGAVRIVAKVLFPE